MDEIQFEPASVSNAKIPCRIREPTAKDRARQIMMGLTSVLAVIAFCMVLAGVSLGHLS